LKALGFTRRQLASTVAWQSTIAIGIGVIVGVPLGIVAGRALWTLFARLQKLLEERKITLTLDNKARDWLAEKGWDPAYGARPLKRVIQKHVQDPLAEMILSGQVHDGETVHVAAAYDGLTFNGKIAQAA